MSLTPIFPIGVCQKVIITVRCESERHGWIHPELVSWLLGLTNEQTHQVAIRLVYGGLGFAHSGNLCANVLLDEYPEAEWLCILDNDVVPPPDLLRILDGVPACIDLIGPVSHMMQNHVVRPQCGHYATGEKGEWLFRPLEIDGNNLGPREVDRIGGCCVFIRRGVFGVIPRPYFKTHYNPETWERIITDDTHFQLEAKKAGCRLFVDTRFVASHYHSMDLAMTL